MFKKRKRPKNTRKKVIEKDSGSGMFKSFNFNVYHESFLNGPCEFEMIDFWL